MASEYLKWKARNVPHDPPPRELSRKEKLRNWLDYYKWWVLAGAVVLWIIGGILWNALGIGRIRPDYRAAYVGTESLPEEAAARIRDALAALGEDLNGDGAVTVELRQYIMSRGSDPETALGFQYAADTRLVADITAGESYFFLTEDPESLQRNYHIYALPDGTPPDDADDGAWDKVFFWTACPALIAGREPLPQLAGLTIGRRCFYEEKKAAAQTENEALWQRITKEAAR